MNEGNYVTDKTGRRIAVQIPVKIHNKLLNDSEEFQDIREYRKAGAQKSNPIPFEQTFKEIEDSIK